MPARLRDDDRVAQQVACRFLVAGCERSLFELRASLGYAREPAEVRTGLQAVQVLESVLAGWRETLVLLCGTPAAKD